MIEKNMKQRMFRPFNQTALWLVVQCVVILTLISLPLAFIANTNAKYTAMAESIRIGQVARWDVYIDVKNLPAKKKLITPIPLNAAHNTETDKTKPLHPLVLFFEGKDPAPNPTNLPFNVIDPKGLGAWVKKSASFPITLINDSQVSAIYTPDIDVDAPSKALIKPYILFYEFDGNFADVYDATKPGTYLDLTNPVPARRDDIIVVGAGPNNTNLVIPPMTSGAVLHPGQSKNVAVVIKPCTFTNLRFWAVVEQLD